MGLLNWLEKESIDQGSINDNDETRDSLVVDGDKKRWIYMAREAPRHVEDANQRPDRIVKVRDWLGVCNNVEDGN